MNNCASTVHTCQVFFIKKNLYRMSLYRFYRHIYSINLAYCRLVFLFSFFALNSYTHTPNRGRSIRSELSNPSHSFATDVSTFCWFFSSLPNTSLYLPLAGTPTLKFFLSNGVKLNTNRRFFLPSGLTL